MKTRDRVTTALAPQEAEAMPDPRTLLRRLAPPARFQAVGHQMRGGVRLTALRATDPGRVKIFRFLPGVHPGGLPVVSLEVWADRHQVVYRMAITFRGTIRVDTGKPVSVMEATSSYWKPPFYLLEDAIECWVVNARDVKNVPGRPKTGKLDAVWLCKLAERGMLRPSFVPPPWQRELRDLCRYRRTLIQERTREKQRAEKLLEDAQIKLSSVISDIFGKSGRDMLEALIAGQRDPYSILTIAYHLLSDPDARFTDLGPDWHDRLTPIRRKRQLITELERLSGKKVLLQDEAA